MDFDEVIHLEAEVESIFDSSLKNDIKGGSSGFPRYVFNMNRDGKDLTSSELDGDYKKFGRAFHSYMPIARTSAGPGAGKTIKGGVIAVFVNAQDLLEVEYTTLTVGGLPFDLAVIEVHNVNDTKSTKKGFVYKGSTLLAHPVPFTDNCKALICKYKSFQAQSGLIDEETGAPKGNKDVVKDFSFDKGGMTK